MNAVKTKEASRTELVDTVIQSYMELFMTMQFNSVSHWLMLELTFAQSRALFMLAARKELTVGALAKLLDVGKATASILVQQLVERGLVTRTEQESDRRHTILRLSPKGEEIGAGRREQRARQWKHWLSQLSDDELKALAHGLTAIVTIMKKDLEQETQQGAQPRSKREK